MAADLFSSYIVHQELSHLQSRRNSTSSFSNIMTTQQEHETTASYRHFDLHVPLWHCSNCRVNNYAHTLSSPNFQHRYILSRASENLVSTVVACTQSCEARIIAVCTADVPVKQKTSVNTRAKSGDLPYKSSNAADSQRPILWFI